MASGSGLAGYVGGTTCCREINPRDSRRIMTNFESSNVLREQLRHMHADRARFTSVQYYPEVLFGIPYPLSLREASRRASSSPDLALIDLRSPPLALTRGEHVPDSALTSPLTGSPARDARTY